MTKRVVGRLDRGGKWLAEVVQATIDRARISFAFPKGEAWLGELHRLTAADGLTIEFMVSRRSVYATDSTGVDEFVEGGMTAYYRA